MSNRPPTARPSSMTAPATTESGLWGWAHARFRRKGGNSALRLRCSSHSQSRSDDPVRRFSSRLIGRGRSTPIAVSSDSSRFGRRLVARLRSGRSVGDRAGSRIARVEQSTPAVALVVRTGGRANAQRWLLELSIVTKRKASNPVGWRPCHATARQGTCPKRLWLGHSDRGLAARGALPSWERHQTGRAARPPSP